MINHLCFHISCMCGGNGEHRAHHWMAGCLAVLTLVHIGTPALAVSQGANPADFGAHLGGARGGGCGGGGWERNGAGRSAAGGRRAGEWAGGIRGGRRWCLHYPHFISVWDVRAAKPGAFCFLYRRTTGWNLYAMLTELSNRGKVSAGTKASTQAKCDRYSHGISIRQVAVLDMFVVSACAQFDSRICSCLFI